MNQPCVFPFKFQEITYNNCTTADNDPDDTNAWCSTKVDEFGNHVPRDFSGENWGVCETKCQNSFRKFAVLCLIIFPKMETKWGLFVLFEWIPDLRSSCG